MCIEIAFVQVQAIILPAYSPELNPCELCFNVVKAFLRRSAHLRRGVDLDRAVVDAFMATVTVQKMIRFYVHAVWNRGQSQ